jgi:hypothetical protein
MGPIVVKVNREMQQLVKEGLRLIKVDFLSIVDFPIVFR